MSKIKLIKIPNSDKFRITGLTKEQIEALKKSNKGNALDVLAVLGGAGLVAAAISDLDGVNYDEIVAPDIPIEDSEATEDPIIDESPVEPTPEPSPEEILNIIDIDETIDNFEKLDFDDDLIDEVIDSGVEDIVIDSEMEDYINSDDFLDDLNDESDEIDGIVINDEFIDENDFSDDIFDEDGYVIDDTIEIDNDLIDEFEEQGFDEDLIDEAVEDIELDEITIDDEMSDYIESDEFLDDLNDESEIDGDIVNDEFIDEDISTEGLLDFDDFETDDYDDIDIDIDDIDDIDDSDF